MSRKNINIAAIDKKVTEINNTVKKIAILRDTLREQMSEYEELIESVDNGVESLQDGLRSLQSGLDSISERL